MVCIAPFRVKCSYLPCLLLADLLSSNRNSQHAFLNSFFSFCGFNTCSKMKRKKVCLVKTNLEYKTEWAHLTLSNDQYMYLFLTVFYNNKCVCTHVRSQFWTDHGFGTYRCGANVFIACNTHIQTWIEKEYENWFKVIW